MLRSKLEVLAVLLGMAFGIFALVQAKRFLNADDATPDRERVVPAPSRLPLNGDTRRMVLAVSFNAGSPVAFVTI